MQRWYELSSMHDVNDLFCRERLDATLFDLDGVLIASETLHAGCWKRMFDAFLRQRSRERGEVFHAFDVAADDLLPGDR